MIKSQVKACLERCVALGAQQGYWPEDAAKSCGIEVPKRAEQGDFSTNFAMMTAGRMQARARDLAARLVELLAREPMFAKVEIAGPGFVNFFLKPSIWAQVLAPVYYILQVLDFVL